MSKSTPARSDRKATGANQRARRTKAEMGSLCDSLHDILCEIQPATVRQLFYQATVRGLLPKIEQSYKLVCRLLTIMRRSGHVPYSWIADNSRWQRKPRTFNSLEAMLDITAATYRRALWSNQESYCEIWLEKESLSGVVVSKTAEYDVPLMVCRGYPSVSFLYAAAMQIAAIGKPTFISYLGDHDPSGIDIDRFVEGQLRELAPRADITFDRVAVLPYQIEMYDLPTRPTKKSDSRAKGFQGRSVELDAISPDRLRTLCETCITQHIDYEALEAMRTVERAEKETLRTIAAGLDGAA
jgi:hypothetical protein